MADAKLHVTYNDIHNLIRRSTAKIADEFNPDLLIAIGMENRWLLTRLTFSS